MFKRAFDVTLVTLGLILIFPQMIFIAIWIKKDSEGPVFFRQTRVGKDGKLFEVIKFRTMVVDAENKGSKVTVDRDPRITRAGAWLRKRKLDELPQLFNVLMGDMSLVGPRPEVPEYVEFYSDEDRRVILSVLPGITDNAAIEFRDESQLLKEKSNPVRVYKEEILPKKIALYKKYVDNQTLLGDFRLIFRTLVAIVN
jgi:lipopolysaccharide/colanic/teichoic acid biosynthesis glycosyltransferase